MSPSTEKLSCDGHGGEQNTKLRPSHFSLEELSEDDIGYDGDIEVVRPEYEDAESGSEDGAHEDEGYDSADSEDQLAYRLRGLFCDPNTPSNSNKHSPKRGRKRMSVEMEPTADSALRLGRSDIEIMELCVHTDDNQPTKRRKKARSKAGERTVRLLSLDRADNATTSRAESPALGSSPRSNEYLPTHEESDEEMMDVT